jgi:sugar phosphate isomerase/epimerase
MIFNDIGMDTASLAGPLERKLAEVRRAGFSQVMISAGDVVGHPGGVAAGVRAVRDSGLAVTGVEALRDFEGCSGRLRAYKVDVAKSMLEVCGDLGGRLLVVEASTSVHVDANADAIVRDLRRLAVLAIPFGIRIAFKGVSWSKTVRNCVAAGELVYRANCPNLGLAIDAFDVLAARIPLDDLDAIDPEQIFLVQLSDYMWQEIRSAEEQATTATHFRVFPGEGAHSDELADFITKLDAIGYCGDYSFDVYNDDYLQMPPETVADRARRAAEWLGETVLRRALPIPDMERLRRAVPG